MRKQSRFTFMTLWHVTSKDNINSILEVGIDPSRATADIKRIWLVQWWGLTWALLHISIKKHIPVWELVAFKVKVRNDRLVHFNRRVYTCNRALYPRDYWRADQILSAIERQREFKRRSYRPETIVARSENDLSWLGE